MAEVKDLVIQLSLENDKLKKQLSDTEKAGKKAGKSIGDSFEQAQKKILAGLAAFGAIKASLDFGKEFAAFRQAADSTEKQFGVSADAIISSLSKVSKGTISNTDIIQSANKAMALNVTKDIGKMAQILEIARVRGQALGLDTRQAFDDLVTGIGRNSPLMLDNLGIITKGWAEEAASAGVAYDAQFILNKVLKDGAELLKNTGEVQVTVAERFQQVEATMKNTRVELGEALLPIIENLSPVVNDLVEGIGKMPVQMRAVGIAVGVLTPLLFALNAALGPIGLAIAGIAIATSAAIVAYNQYTKALADQKEKETIANQEKLSKSLGDTLDKYKNLTIEEKNRLKTLKDQNKEYNESIKSLENMGESFTAMKNGVPIIIKTKDAISELTKKIKTNDQEITKLTEKEIKNNEVKKETVVITAEVLTEEQKLAEAKRKADEEEKKRNELIDQANSQLVAYGTNVKDITGAVLSQGDANSQLAKQFIDLSLAIGQAVTAQQKMALAESNGADKTKLNVQNTSDWVTMIIKLVSALGESAAASENAAVRGFGQFIKATQDVGTILRTIAPLISTISDAVKGTEDAWVNLIPVVGPIIQKFRKDVKETTDSVTSEVSKMITEIENEIARANFRIEIEGIDAAEEAALLAAETELGLTSLKEQERQDRISDLDQAIAEETDIEKKSDLQRQKDLITAQEAYEAKRAAIQKEYDEKRAEVKKREFEFELEIRKATIEINRAEAIAEVEKSGTKKQKREAKKTVNASYDELIALVNSIPVPAYATGGIINGLPGIGPEDGYIAAQNGEAVLNRNATATLGKDAIDALNAGRGTSPTTVNITVMDGRGAVEVLNNYFKTQGTSSRGLSI